MDIRHELNRTGETSEWERFWPGYTFFVAANSGKICCTRDGCRVGTKEFPGSVDRAYEEIYADA